MTPETPPPSALRPALTEAELRERAERRKRAQTGEASYGLWQRINFRRAIIEGAAIYALWRLLILLPITAWPIPLFFVLWLGLLVVRFLPPVWAAMRLIATRREKMSRRFFRLAGILATVCAGVDVVIALAMGDPAPLFGGPQYGPDLVRLLDHSHHPLSFGTFFVGELATYGLLLAYFLIATICTRLAQGGFLRFTMPSGNGRVTL